MAQVMEGKLDQASAAARLGISVRQVKRLKRRLLDDGVQGLLSKKRGRPSNRRTPAAVLEGDGPDQGALRGFWPDAGMGTAPVGQPELPIQRLALPSGGRRSGPQLARLGGDDRDSPGQRTRNRWKERVLTYTCRSKPVKQQEPVDGKAVNSKVEKALARRTQPQPIGHPWKQRMDTPRGTKPVRAEFTHTRENFAPLFV